MSRCNPLIAVVLAVAALALPGAAWAGHPRLDGAPHAPVQDLRSPDTRDAAEGRTVGATPGVVVVRVPRPGDPARGSGWSTAAGWLVAALALTAAGAATARRRRVATAS